MANPQCAILTKRASCSYSARRYGGNLTSLSLLWIAQSNVDEIESTSWPCNAASAAVNGKRAGSVWKPPYQLDLTGLVHAGENQIRIVVANTAVNLLAKGPLPDYKELTAKYTERFQAQDMDRVQPLPSGLLGPIRLVTR